MVHLLPGQWKVNWGPPQGERWGADSMGRKGGRRAGPRGQEGRVGSRSSREDGDLRRVLCRPKMESQEQKALDWSVT